MDKPGNFILLFSFLCLRILILFCLDLNRICLFLKLTDRVSPFDFGTVILILSCIFFQNRLELFNTVFVLIQLALNSLKKPFFCQSFFISAVSKKI